MTSFARYLAVLSSEPRASDAGGWTALCGATGDMRLAFGTDTLAVFTDPAAPIVPFDDGGGVLLGHLFPQHGSLATRTTPLRSVPRGTPGSHATLLAGQHWGGYVAFGSGNDRYSAEVFRDPSGFVQCYYLDIGNAVFVSNEVALLLSATGRHAEINWRQVRQHLLAPELKLPPTCLNTIVELLPGCRLTLPGEGSEVEEIWSPWQFSRPTWDGKDKATAAVRVRDAVEVTTKAWANVHGRVLVELSGGLDSSIVATALATQNAPYDALTFFTGDPVGDERPYAKAVAERFGIAMTEGLLDVAQVDLARSDASHLPRPVARLFNQGIDRLSLAAVEHYGSSAIFHGGGGDNVFCYLQSVVPIVDRFRRTGLSPDVVRTMTDVASLSGCGIGEVAWKAARRAMRRGARFQWKAETEFLRSTGEPDPCLSHPWLEPSAAALPGTTGHIAALLRVQNYLHGFARERVVPTIAPLLSQPVVETCLGIPSWLWCENGMNRSVAREAFRDALPPAIYRRRSKGSPDSFVCQIYDRNRHEIRERLLSGPLNGSGLLDTPALERFLADPKPASGLSYLRVLTLLATDNWVRSWSTGRHSKPKSPLPCRS